MNRKELTTELKNILDYWINYTIDERGGHYGKISNDNTVDRSSVKGSVLHSRILWTFSAAYIQLKDKKYLDIANRAADYITRNFFDDKYGGVYWTISADGKPADTKKQVYAQAFALYAFAEHYHASGIEDSKKKAIDLYHLIEQKSHDHIYGGYIEAYSRTWDETQHLKLSEKDANERKSMNTHLHVLEAYSNLYRIWPHDQLKKGILHILELFLEKMINRQTFHLDLFFGDDWKVKPDVISYGHDIEAAWLLQEAAESIRDAGMETEMKKVSLEIAKSVLPGLDSDGGLWYEYEPRHSRLIMEKHWWPQAEAVVGFYNTFQNTGDQQWLDRSSGSWEFIKNNIIDRENGEWFWGVASSNKPMKDQDKVGIWKCPYHNARACLEMIKRLPAK